MMVIMELISFINQYKSMKTYISIIYIYIIIFFRNFNKYGSLN